MLLYNIFNREIIFTQYVNSQLEYFFSVVLFIFVLFCFFDPV